VAAAYETAPAFAPSGPTEPAPAAPWPMTIVTPAVPPELALQSKAALADAMVQAQLDPSKAKVSYWEELVWYPGGTYMNKCLTVETPSGERIDFDAAATLKSPEITARILHDAWSA